MMKTHENPFIHLCSPPHHLAMLQHLVCLHTPLRILHVQRLVRLHLATLNQRHQSLWTAYNIDSLTLGESLVRKVEHDVVKHHQVFYQAQWYGQHQRFK